MTGGGGRRRSTKACDLGRLCRIKDERTYWAKRTLLLEIISDAGLSGWCGCKEREEKGGRESVLKVLWTFCMICNKTEKCDDLMYHS